MKPLPQLPTAIPQILITGTNTDAEFMVFPVGHPAYLARNVYQVLDQSLRLIEVVLYILPVVSKSYACHISAK
jgi:hypothetical protein